MPRIAEHQSPAHEPFHPDAVLARNRAELSSHVLAYVKNIEKQIQDIFSSHNISSIEEFEQSAKEKGVFSKEEIEKLQTLLGLLRKTTATGEIPNSEIPNYTAIIRVESPEKDIINPFAEIYAKNGVPGKEKLEELEIDLSEILETCKETYRKKGLESWADALPSTVAEVISGDSKQQRRFEAYLKEGRIPIFMPPASVQLETMKKSLHRTKTPHGKFETTSRFFTPDIIQSGELVHCGEVLIKESDIKKLFGLRELSLALGVPDEWYILWERLNSRNQASGMDGDAQKKFIKEEIHKFRNKYDKKEIIGEITPIEYLAFQTLYYNIVMSFLGKFNTDIFELDQPCVEGKHVRFIYVETYSNYSALSAQWLTESHRFVLYYDNLDNGGGGGIRTVMRERIQK